MYASLTTVRGAGPDVSTTAAWPPSPCSTGCGSSTATAGLLVLGRPETGNARIVTFWDSLEAIERSDRGRREVRESMVAAAGAELESVERYELFLGEDCPRWPPTGTRPPSHASRPSRALRKGIEEGLRTFREDLVDWFRDATSFRGWIALLDAPRGRSVGITFWASKDALDDERERREPPQRDRRQPADDRRGRRALRGRHDRHRRRRGGLSPPMPDFRDDAKLDTSQVEDLRGRRASARAGSPSAAAGSASSSRC